MSFRIGEAGLLTIGEPLYGVYLRTVTIIKSRLTFLSASLPARAHEQHNADNGGHDEEEHDCNGGYDDDHLGRQTASWFTGNCM